MVPGALDVPALCAPPRGSRSARSTRTCGTGSDEGAGDHQGAERRGEIVLRQVAAQTNVFVDFPSRGTFRSVEYEIRYELIPAYEPPPISVAILRV